MMVNYDLTNNYSVSDSISLDCCNNHVSNFVVSSDLSVNGCNNKIILTDEKPMNFKECKQLSIGGTNNSIINVYFDELVNISVNGCNNIIRGRVSQFYRVKDRGRNNDINIEMLHNVKVSSNEEVNDVSILCREVTSDFEYYLLETEVLENLGVDKKYLKDIKKKYKSIIDKKKYVSNKYYLLGYIVEKRTNKCNRKIVSTLLNELFKSIGFNDIDSISTASDVYSKLDSFNKCKFHYALCSTFYMALVRK